MSRSPEQAAIGVWPSGARCLIADIVKTISQRGARNSPRLWIVTRGAQRLDHGRSVTLAQTAIRGLARVLNFEHPELKDDDRRHRGRRTPDRSTP